MLHHKLSQPPQTIFKTHAFFKRRAYEKIKNIWQA